MSARGRSLRADEEERDERQQAHPQHEGRLAHRGCIQAVPRASGIQQERSARPQTLEAETSLVRACTGKSPARVQDLGLTGSGFAALAKFSTSPASDKEPEPSMF